MLPYSTQRVINPAAADRRTNGTTGTMLRRHEIAPRFHQKITSHAKGSVTIAVLLNKPNRNNPIANA
jgi:hypothetical protein